VIFWLHLLKINDILNNVRLQQNSQFVYLEASTAESQLNYKHTVTARYMFQTLMQTEIHNTVCIQYCTDSQTNLTVQPTIN